MTKTTKQKIVKEYRIGSATEFESLESIVRAAIATGWQPLGGVGIGIYTSVATGHQYHQYVQAMVKYAD